MSHSETAAVSDHWSTPEPTIQYKEFNHNFETVTSSYQTKMHI